jgi:hypothetical protein
MLIGVQPLSSSGGKRNDGFEIRLITDIMVIIVLLVFEEFFKYPATGSKDHVITGRGFLRRDAKKR